MMIEKWTNKHSSKALISYVTLDHKTSHKGIFFEIEIYTFARDTTIRQSGIWGCKKKNFKVDQMKFLAMHITNTKISFNIFTVGNLHNTFRNMIFI